jgi:DNA repair exonuclease SbcCD nuclease subunit
MKILHTSDLHLCSPLTSRLSGEKREIRRAELLNTFFRLCEEAVKIGCEAVIVAGDLFDEKKISPVALESVMTVIKGFPGLTFFYLPGNHEGDAVRGQKKKLPTNLLVFGDEWTAYTLNGVSFVGKSGMNLNLFSGLNLDRKGKNVVILHGSLTDRERYVGDIGIREAAGLGIDYLALGHYHAYSENKLDQRCRAVYPGTPEGRGFDEAHPCGYVVVDTDKNFDAVFVPFAKRRLHDISVDITDISTQYMLECKLNDTLSRISPLDLVRINLTGKRKDSLNIDIKGLEMRHGGRFFHIEIISSATADFSVEELRFDKSFKGEFIRAVLKDDTLDDGEKSRIIDAGIAALTGGPIENG